MEHIKPRIRFSGGAKICCLLLAILLGSCSSSPSQDLYGSPSIVPRSPAPFTSPPPSPVLPSQASLRGELVRPGTPTPLFPGPPAPSTPTPSPRVPTPLACWTGGGQIETGSLPVDLLPEPLEFRVYLPPCYEEEPGRRYPSLYLIHGQSYTDDQWDRLGADETAEALITAGEAPPFLIIMPRDRRWDQPEEDHFGQAVAEVLIPWIDGHYRTRAERPYRAVGGLSRGASWAVHLALSHWELFGALGAHSLPVFWTDTYHIKEWLNAIPSDQMPRIYMDNPNNDRSEIIKSSIWFERLLTQKNIPHEWHLFTGYHEEKYWQSHVEQYLRWYTEGW